MNFSNLIDQAKKLKAFSPFSSNFYDWKDYLEKQVRYEYGQGVLNKFDEVLCIDEHVLDLDNEIQEQIRYEAKIDKIVEFLEEFRDSVGQF